MSSSGIGDGNSVALIRTASSEDDIEDAKPSPVEADNDQTDQCEEDPLGNKKRPRIFSFGRKYSPLEQRQKQGPQPSVSSPLVEDNTAVYPHRTQSTSYSPKPPSKAPHVRKGPKDLLKRAKGSLVQMVTSKPQGDYCNDHYLGTLGDMDNSSDEGVEGAESPWEEPLEPVPPSWVKYGYVMIGEKSQSGKVKWTERVSILASC